MAEYGPQTRLTALRETVRDAERDYEDTLAEVFTPGKEVTLVVFRQHAEPRYIACSVMHKRPTGRVVIGTKVWIVLQNGEPHCVEATRLKEHDTL